MKITLSSFKKKKIVGNIYFSLKKEICDYLKLPYLLIELRKNDVVVSSDNFSKFFDNTEQALEYINKKIAG